MAPLPLVHQRAHGGESGWVDSPPQCEPGKQTGRRSGWPCKDAGACLEEWVRVLTDGWMPPSPAQREPRKQRGRRSGRPWKEAGVSMEEGVGGGQVARLPAAGITSKVCGWTDERAGSPPRGQHEPRKRR